MSMTEADKFQIKKDIQIQNRTKIKPMATDIWFLLNSFVDDRLNPECNEITILTKKHNSNGLNQGCADLDQIDFIEIARS
ncbi:unnamed protein product [Brachionus calyciflorus]|uniref:Uncharacterized protein n=1 Tax=Brachionus calyciflorus TaxID=104777 RepID=A0A814CJN7_9BILA|nr:unnamed protein product [Brachionus calyciflorus]